jgi:hypothetical protein
MSMSQRFRLGMAGSLVLVSMRSLLGGRVGWRFVGSDEAESQQPGRLAVFAGAVGFDEAAVDGLTAAVFLELALEFLERWTPHAVHLLQGWGWRWGARPSVSGSGFAPAHRALFGAR